jgi:endonuclease/exonuclease/phosphatase (EEP) superfamily protein YafD
MIMLVAYLIFAWLLIIATYLPLVNHTHWVFRVFDFGKIQLLFLEIIVLILGIFLVSDVLILPVTLFALAISIVYIASILFVYTSWYKVDRIVPNSSHSSKSITLISANVYQFNRDYPQFIQLINRIKPDIFLTMESNQDWENAMVVLEKDYPYFHKIPLENTYGMHLYSKFAFKKVQAHYFVADDIPSIEAELVSSDNYTFTIFALHPPPPSPTEEENSKERDGELLSVAKKIKSSKKQTFIAVGDFNTVAWGRASILFRKTSEMIDPRIGRGLISTFHAKYKLLRFPIDQLFHTTDVFVEEIKALPNFGSDHLPIFCQFIINHHDDSQTEHIETLEEGDMEKVNEIIAEGKAEQSDREAVVTE